MSIIFISAIGLHERRRDKRMTTPMAVFFDRQIHRVLDWSLSGLRLRIGQVRPAVGTRMAMLLKLPAEPDPLPVRGRIVWLDAEAGEAGIAFEAMAPAIWERLERYCLHHTARRLA